MRTAFYPSSVTGLLYAVQQMGQVGEEGFLFSFSFFFFCGVGFLFWALFFFCFGREGVGGRGLV